MDIWDTTLDIWETSTAMGGIAPPLLEPAGVVQTTGSSNNSIRSRSYCRLGTQRLREVESLCEVETIYYPRAERWNGVRGLMDLRNDRYGWHYKPERAFFPSKRKISRFYPQWVHHTASPEIASNPLRSRQLIKSPSSTPKTAIAASPKDVAQYLNIAENAASLRQWLVERFEPAMSLTQGLVNLVPTNVNANVVEAFLEVSRTVANLHGVIPQIVFHGTGAENIPKINTEGLRTPRSLYPTHYTPYIWTATSAATSRGYMRGATEMFVCLTVDITHLGLTNAEMENIATRRVVATSSDRFLFSSSSTSISEKRGCRSRHRSGRKTSEEEDDEKTATGAMISIPHPSSKRIHKHTPGIGKCLGGAFGHQNHHRPGQKGVNPLAGYRIPRRQRKDRKKESPLPVMPSRPTPIQTSYFGVLCHGEESLVVPLFRATPLQNISAPLSPDQLRKQTTGLFEMKNPNRGSMAMHYQSLIEVSKYEIGCKEDLHHAHRVGRRKRSFERNFCRSEKYATLF